MNKINYFNAFNEKAEEWLRHGTFIEQYYEFFKHFFIKENLDKYFTEMFKYVTVKNFDILTEEDELANGGSALIAYERMQFSEMNEMEKKELLSVFHHYCELGAMPR